MGYKKGLRNGFTLIEVIVSLAILALLMVPALSIYSVVTKSNTRAQADQKAVDLGQNLIETLKTKNMDEISMMFNGVQNFQILNSNLNGFVNTYQMRTYSNNGYGEYKKVSGSLIRLSPGDAQSSLQPSGIPGGYLYSPPAGKGNFIYGIEHIMEGQTEFDAVITLDATDYRDTVKYPDSMNNYKLPDLNALDRSKVTILDLEGATTVWSDQTVTASCDNSKACDNQAVADFMNIQLSYLVYLDEELTPTPHVVYSVDDIKGATQKNIQINIQKNSLTKTIQIDCVLVYTCNLDLNGDGSQEITSYNLFSESNPVSGAADLDREIYLLYTPSAFHFQDVISINNNGAKVKLTIAKQEGISANDVIVGKSEVNMANTAIYTNLTDDELEAGSIPNITQHTLVTKEEATDRIYKIKVEIYKGGSISSGDMEDPYAVYTSTKIRCH